MAIQTLYGKEHLYPSLGQSLGSGLGSALGGGLALLAQDKVANMQRQRRAREWENIGLPSNVAHFLVSQPESIQKEFLDRLEGLDITNPQGQFQQNVSNVARPEQQMLEQQIGQQQVPQQAKPMQIPGQENVSEEILANAIQPTSNLKLGPSKEQRKEQQRSAEHAFKETKDFRHNVIESKKAARNTLKDLSRLEELSESGKLDTPGYVEFLERAGLEIPALMNPESEEFKKIQQSFLKDAKQYFGGRVSNYEIEQFLKTIPSLSQSPEGRSRVIANLKYIARGADEYYKAAQEVLKENKGVPPLDIEEQVEEKVDKRLDRIAQQFRKDLAKPVPKGQNKLITALQAGAGSLLGLPGTVLGGAGKALGTLGAALV